MTTSITAFPITAKQIAELTSASSAAGTDYLMAQQGATGTAYRKMTVAQIMASGAAVLASGVTVNAATVPANGVYLPAANTLGLAVNSVGEVSLTSSALSPITSDGNALGTTSLMWADLFLASGGVINFNAGNYTLTHSAGLLTASGPITINTASNGASGTAVPSGITLSDSSSGSSWDIVNPWQKIEFYTADISTGGPGGRVRIGPVAESTIGGASRLAIFQTATAGTYLEKWALTSAGRMLVGGVPTDDGVHTIQATGSAALNLNAATAPANLSGTVLRATQLDATNAYFLIDTFAGQGFLTFRKSAGTNAAPTALGSGTTFGSISARGHDGTAYSGERGNMSILTDEAWTATAHGTAFIFSTTTAGTTTLVQRVKIDSAGNTIFGLSGNTISLTHHATGSSAASISGGSTGGLSLKTSGGEQFRVIHAASAVNYVGATGGATGGGVTVSAAGSDSNINLTLTPKGTGVVAATGINAKTVSNALTAAGTTRADALALTAEVNRVTTAAASTGVILPTGVIGMIIRLFNNGANPIKVYAAGSETIDGTAGSTGVTLTNALRCQYVFVAANTWVSGQIGAVSA